jgi:hypothetical protein
MVNFESQNQFSESTKREYSIRSRKFSESWGGGGGGEYFGVRRVRILPLFNPLKTKRICFIQGLSAYRAVNTLHFGYKNQSLNVL